MNVPPIPGKGCLVGAKKGKDRIYIMIENSPRVLGQIQTKRKVTPLVDRMRVEQIRVKSIGN